MGTETSWISHFVMFVEFSTVKLNDPLMGTETAGYTAENSFLIINTC